MQTAQLKRMTSGSGIGAPVTLQALALSASAFAINALPGTFIAAIVGVSRGSVVTVNDSRVAVGANNTLVVGPTAASSPGDFDVTLTESRAFATNSPRSTVVTLTAQASLGALSLSSSVITTSDAAGAVIGAIQGKTAGSTVTVVGDTRVAVSGNNLVVGSTPASIGTFQVTLRETLASAANSPRDTVVTLTVNAAPVSLAALSLSASTFTVGDPAGSIIGAIQNLTPGSTVEVFPNDGRVSIDGSNRLIIGLTAAAAGAFSVTLRETLASAGNSPRSTTVTITVQAAPSATDPVTYDIKITTLTGLRAGSGVTAGGTSYASFKAAAIALGKGVGSTLKVAIAPDLYAPPDGESPPGSIFYGPSDVNEYALQVTPTWADANGAEILVTGLYKDPTNRPVIDRIQWQTNVYTQVRFQWVHLCTREWHPEDPNAWATGADPNNDSSRGSNKNCAVEFLGTCVVGPSFEEGVYVTANYRGDHNHIWDPTGVLLSDDGTTKVHENRYVECAHIMPVLTGTSITELRIGSSDKTDGTKRVIHYNNYVGDNCHPSWRDGVTGEISDGWWPVLLSPKATTVAGVGGGFEGYFHTVGGRMAPDTDPESPRFGKTFDVVNPGTGYSAARVEIYGFCYWLGRRSMTSFMPFALIGAGGGGGITGNCNYDGVHFHGGYTAIRIAPAAPGRTLRINNCLFERQYADGLNMPQNEPYRCDGLTATFNVFKEEAWCLEEDPGRPHGDNVQAYVGKGSNGKEHLNYPLNFLVVGNIGIAGAVRGGGSSGWLTTDLTESSPYYLTGYWIANYLLTRQNSNGLALAYVQDAMILNNMQGRYNIDSGSCENAGTLAQITFGSKESAFCLGNVADGVAVTSGADLAGVENNFSIAKDSALYHANMVDPEARPLTREGVLAAFATKGAAAAYGPQAGGIIDWATRTINWANVPIRLKVTNVVGQDPAAAVSTRWTRILGGADSGTITIAGSGMTFQIADNWAGLNASQEYGPGATYSGPTRDKWVRMTCAAVGTALASRKATLTINGTGLDWVVTTRSATSYARVYNQKAAYSMATIPSQGGQLVDRFAVAMVIDFESMKTGSIFTGSGSLAGLSFKATTNGSIISLSMGTSGGIFGSSLKYAPKIQKDTTIVWLVDLTKTGADRVKWMMDYDVPLTTTSAPAAPGTVNVDSILASPQRWLSSSSSATDTKPSMLLMDWGQSSAGYTLPAIDTLDQRIALFLNLQRDRMAADVSTPFGHAPKLCWFDGDWNAGLANRGSIAGVTLTKTTGTYIDA